MTLIGQGSVVKRGSNGREARSLRIRTTLGPLARSSLSCSRFQAPRPRCRVCRRLCSPPSFAFTAGPLFGWCRCHSLCAGQGHPCRRGVVPTRGASCLEARLQRLGARLACLAMPSVRGWRRAGVGAHYGARRSFRVASSSRRLAIRVPAMATAAWSVVVAGVLWPRPRGRRISRAGRSVGPDPKS